MEFWVDEAQKTEFKKLCDDNLFSPTKVMRKLFEERLEWLRKIKK